MNNQITTTGSWIAVVSVLVSILAHFGIIFDANQLGQSIADGVKFFADISIVYGIIHQFIVTKSANKTLEVKGIKIK